MAESAELNIVLQLIDNATTGIQQATSSLKTGMDKATGSVHSFGQELNSTGRELTRMGSVLTFTGGAIQAFFIKSITDASKGSVTLTDTLQLLSTEFNHFEGILTSAVSPIIDKIINYLGNLNKYLDSIPRALRDQIIQWTFLSSIFLTLGGLTTILAGKILELAGNFLKLASSLVTNPFFLIAAGLTAIILLMFKFSDTTRQVLNTLQAFFLALKEGFFNIKADLENFVTSALMNLSKLDEALANVSRGSLKNFFLEASANAQTAANSIRSLVTKDMKTAQDAALELQNIFMNKDGSWAAGFINVKDKVTDLINFLKNLGNQTNTVKNIFDNAFNDLKQKVVSLTDTFNQGFGDALGKMIVEGKNFGQSMMKLFDDMAEKFISDVGAMIAKWLAFTALKGALAFFGFNSGGLVPGFSQGGIVQGFNQGSGGVLHLASGADTIPAMLSPGEIVIPRSFSDAIRTGQLSLSGGSSNPGSSGQGVTVNVYYPKMSSKSEVQKLANDLGMEIQRQLRYAI